MMWRVLFSVLFAFSTSAHALRLLEVRSSADQDSTRLVLGLSGAPTLNVLSLANPERLVVDVTNLDAGSLEALTRWSDTRVTRVRTSVRQSGSRLVFDLAAKYRTNVFALTPTAGNPHRLVVDIIGYVAGERQAIEPTSAPEPPVQKRDIVIAIDPGHGGKDPGASSYGVIEKEVVLQISKQIAARFQKEPGFRAVLTRSDDRFIRLSDRPKLARDAGADFFVSIHADSFPKNRSVRGAGVYALSLRGANSELSRWLQNQENSADLAGGVDLGDVDDETRQMLLNMSMESAIRISMQAGDGLLANLSRVGRVHKKELGLANFVVLRSPDIPSLLVETGFLSNQQDAKRLSNVREQDRIAEAVYLVIRAYFERSPPANTYLFWRKQQEGRLITIEVKRGDTLSEIANRYGLTVNALKELNDLNSDVIRLGQQLQVPLRP